MTGIAIVRTFIHQRNVECSCIFEKFCTREARRLALACRAGSTRFLRGGRLLALGRGAYAAGAQHVPVELAHPVIAGQRALPALDLANGFRRSTTAIARPGGRHVHTVREAIGMAANA